MHAACTPRQSHPDVTEKKKKLFSLSPFPPALIGEPQPDSIQPWVLTLVTARPPRAQPCRSGPEVPSTSVLPAPSGANCSLALPIDPLAIPVPVHRSIRTTGTTRNTPSDLSVHLPGCRMHPPRGRWVPFVSRQAAKLMPSTYGVRPLCTRACRTGYIVRESSIPGLSFECPRPLCTANPGYSGHFHASAAHKNSKKKTLTGRDINACRPRRFMPAPIRRYLVLCRARWTCFANFS